MIIELRTQFNPSRGLLHSMIVKTSCGTDWSFYSTTHVTCHTVTFLTEHSRPFLVAPASIRRQIGLIDFLGPLNGPFTDFCDLCPHAPCSWLTIPVISSVTQWHLMGQVLILHSYVNMVNRCDITSCIANFKLMGIAICPPSTQHFFSSCTHTVYKSTHKPACCCFWR